MLSEGFYHVCRALECEFGSLGLGLVVGRALGLCSEQEGDQEFPCLFCVALAHPFRSEGGVEYANLPSVARAVTPPVSYYRVSPSGGPCPIR